MMSVNISTVHKRETSVSFTHTELAEIIAKAAADKVREKYGSGPKIKGRGVTFNVDFEDATEGSPSYRIGTKARVKIVEDLSPQAE